MQFQREPCDDSDMKIARMPSPVERVHEALGRADEGDYIRNKDNGNLKKARELGEALAKIALEHEESLMKWGLFPDGADQSLASQKRILMCFALTAGARSLLSNDYVANTTLNVCYDLIKTSDLEFYDDVQEAGEYSFYYLDLRRKGQVEHSIGRTFAMLCGQDGNSVFSELGEVLYCRFYHEGCKITRTYDFIP